MRFLISERELKILIREIADGAAELTPTRQKIDSLVENLVRMNEILASYSTKEGAKVTIGLGARKSGKYINVYYAFNYEFPEGDSSYSFSGKIYDVHHVIMNELEMPKEIKDELASKIPYGFIQISKESPTEDREYEKCKGPNGKTPYYVHLTSPTKKGWGPLLYDVAIDYASMDGSGLMSDRTSVSPEARGVWAKYAMRPDVLSHQMDTHALSNDSGLKQRTPNDNRDDCSQYVAITSKDRLDWNRLRNASDEYLDSSELERKRELERIWQESPLSKIYFTSGETIGVLKSNKMFWMHD